MDWNNFFESKKGVAMKNKYFLTLIASVITILWLSQGVMAAKGIYIPLFTYKTGPFA